jgi:hypothetical protein
LSWLPMRVERPPAITTPVTSVLSLPLAMRCDLGPRRGAGKQLWA